MVRYFKSTILLLVALYISTLLTGCAVAVVGAIGAAGIKVVDNQPGGNLEPVAKDLAANAPALKDPAVKVYPIERAGVQSAEKKLEASVKNTAAPTAKAPDTQVAAAQLPAEPSFVKKPTQAPISEFPSVKPQQAEPAKSIESADATSQLSPRHVINNTSFERLVGHAWKLAGMRAMTEFTFDGDQSVFVFSKHGDFKALISCNYISGKFSANDAGKFFLNKLNASHNSCGDSRLQEVTILGMLLDANEFFINDRTLILGKEGNSSLAFLPTDKTLDLNEMKKAVLVKKTKAIKKSSHIKSKQTQPSNQKKHAHINSQ